MQYYYGVLSSPNQPYQLIVSLQYTNRTPSLRLFITSRPEGHIQSSFNFISRTSTHPSSTFHKHELHKVAVTDSDAYDNDITKFLTHELRPIAQRRVLVENWPGEEYIRRLSEKSGGLFIYTVTVCRFLSSHN